MKIISATAVVVLALILASCSGGGGGGGGGGGTPAGISLSGTIFTPQGVAADSDVNDPAAPFATNDTPATAQLVSNPATVSGFASMTGSGPAGSRFASVPDVFDGYRLNLAAGQLVTLTVSQWNDQAPTAVDLDLFLFDVNLNLVASSEGVGPVESIIVPADGSYYVVIEAFAGASTYQMTIGAQVLSASAARDRLSRFDDFATGEVLVSLKQEIKGQSRAAAMARMQSSGAVAAGGESGNAPFLLRLNGPQALAAGEILPPKDRWSGQRMSPAMAARADTIRTVKAIRGSSETRGASPNYILQAQAVPNDPLVRYQWHYPMINLPQAWDTTIGGRAGNPVVVAVVDTGVKLAHPDLVNQLVPGYDFVRNSVSSLDGDGIDANPDDPGDGSTGGASSWHGTHVAGTVAAQTNNGIGVAGVAPLAKIMPVRVLGRQGRGETFDILQGIRYAAGLSNTSGTVPPQRADVINLSLGGGAYDQTTQDAIAEARAAGVIVVAAAGNDNVSAPKYPASYAGVVSVSAVGMNGSKASYSSFGPTIDVTAPGGDSNDLNVDGASDGVVSTFVLEPLGVPQFGYGQLAGTSMAAPHVAGVAALMRAIAPSMTPAQFDTLLADGALTNDIGGAGRDDLYGYGLIDALKSVKAAQTLASVSSTSAALTPSLSRLDFGTASTQQTLRLSNAGTGALSLTSITESAPWLAVTPVAVDSNGLGDYILSVNRNSLAPGAYSTTITIAANTGNTTIPVTLGVASNPQAGNAGRIYVLLVNPVTGDTVKTFPVNAVSGNYSYSFTDVAAGTYMLVAGADLDNDDFVCGAGEACGGWPLASELSELQVTATRSGLDFTLSPDATLIQSAATSATQGFRGYPRLPASHPRSVR